MLTSCQVVAEGLVCSLSSLSQAGLSLISTSSVAGPEHVDRVVALAVVMPVVWLDLARLGSRSVGVGCVVMWISFFFVVAGHIVNEVALAGRPA